MPAAKRPADDAQRVAALRRYGFLDTMASPQLGGLVDLATVVAGTPRAVVNLIDADRQWQAAAAGADPVQVERDAALCSHVVAEGRTIYTADASRDARFADNPHVTGALDTIRLYAGVPLRDSSGHVLGSLCVFDAEPGELGERQLAALVGLADQVVALLELHRRAHVLTDALTELDLLAQTDPLTGLPNRRALANRLNNSQGNLVLLFVDLDDFKRVNDTLGHDAGDQVLREAAVRLQSAVRVGDLVARHGGDEFVVVCGPLAEQDARAMADRLRRDLSQPYDTDHGAALLGASVGVSVLRPGEGGSDLLRRADAAMYRQKATRPARTAFLEPARPVRAADRSQLAG